MADPVKNAEAKNSELDDLAFQIYAQRLAASPAKRGGEQEALDSFRKAESFIVVRNRVKAGGTKQPAADAPVLADCCAPNLPKTHPYNLVSQRMGDVNKVNRIKAWLDANPTPESGPEELVDRINQHFPELTWDAVAVSAARAIFPAFAKN